MKIAGIDEAGKGCVVGPLVVAGVCLEKEKEEKLRELGVRDSKRVPHQKRIELADRIRKIARVEVVKIDAEKLDEQMRVKTINEILKDCFAELILNLKPDVAFVDSPDVLPDRLATELQKITGCRIVAEHRADEKYAVVSAASIVAKVERETEIEKIKEIAGNFGSGYASDPATREFLKRLISEGKLPSYVRKRWRTISNLSQQTLEDFC